MLPGKFQDIFHAIFRFRQKIRIKIRPPLSPRAQGETPVKKETALIPRTQGLAVFSGRFLRYVILFSDQSCFSLSAQTQR